MPPTITPQQFVAKWRGDTRKERSVAQEHFIDLCRMLGVPGHPVQSPRTTRTSRRSAPPLASWSRSVTAG
jgi:hypothetical protein